MDTESLAPKSSGASSVLPSNEESVFPLLQAYVALRRILENSVNE
jgi:hypothetical protein